MSAKYDVVLSDDLDKAIDAAVAETRNTKSEVLRKALQLYLAALDGNKQGMKLGLVDPLTEKLKTEFVGL